jgi:hypothetical protein
LFPKRYFFYRGNWITKKAIFGLEVSSLKYTYLKLRIGGRWGAMDVKRNNRHPLDIMVHVIARRFPKIMLKIAMIFRR